MISGERIRQAREICGLTQAELAAAADVEQSHISMIEKGAREPSEQVVEAIALRTGFGPGFFNRSGGPEFPEGSLLYRRRKSASSSDLARIRQHARLAFELNETLASRFKIREITLPEGPEDPSSAARLARTALSLSPETPISNLINRLERSGVIVIPTPLGIDDHDAFSLWADTNPRKPVIVYSTRKSGDRQRFSIAHEVGHLLLHRSPIGNAEKAEEEANAFAGELLLPEEALRSEVNLPLTLTGLAEMKGRWGVSMQAIVERLYRLTIITEGQRKYVYRKLSAKGWRRHEPVEIAQEKPRLLAKMAEMLMGTGYAIEKLASQVNAPPRLVAELIAGYAGANAQRQARTGAQGVPSNGVSLLEFRARSKVTKR